MTKEHCPLYRAWNEIPNTLIKSAECYYWDGDVCEDGRSCSREWVEEKPVENITKQEDPFFSKKEVGK